jgi:hypothetical protein
MTEPASVTEHLTAKTPLRTVRDQGPVDELNDQAASVPAIHRGMPALGMSLVQLQRTVGNRAAQRLIAQQAKSSPQPSLTLKPRPPVSALQLARVKLPEKRAAMSINMLNVQELTALLEQLKGTKDHGLQVKLADDETNGDVIAEADAELKRKSNESKGFHVSGRSEHLPEAVVCSTNAKVAEIAKQENLMMVDDSVFGQWTEMAEGFRNQGFPVAYRNFGDTKIIIFRTTRLDKPNADNSASAKPLPAPPAGTQLKIDFPITKPCTRGDESNERKAAMNGWTALSYAIETGFYNRDAKVAMEWIHLIGSSIGGDNAPGNLVSGTFDANTKMIPFETQIVNRAKSVKPADPSTHLTYRVEVELLPDQTGQPTWVAKTLVQTLLDAGNRPLIYSSPIYLQSTEVMTRAEYSIEMELFKQWLGL